MTFGQWTAAVALAAMALVSPAGAETASLVSADNFVRAETDRYFTGIAARALGKFDHRRELTPIDAQDVVRMNRDTLYSVALFDLDAGPVTVTVPDPGNRFLSLQVIDQDHYTHGVFYGAGKHTLNRRDVGTRYVVTAVRILVDPARPGDVEAVHALQDSFRVEQLSPGRFEVPKWDEASQTKVRDALLVLASTLPDAKGMFGAKGRVDPVRRLIGSASAWGGNPETEATYLTFFPKQNDGTTVHRLVARDVPVDGFWSISVYDEKGYYQANPQNAYTLNNLTASKSADGSVPVQFGGCDGKTPNCLPITKGWNYLVRLYRPRAAILDGSWKFPDPQPVAAGG